MCKNYGKDDLANDIIIYYHLLLCWKGETGG